MVEYFDKNAPRGAWFEKLRTVRVEEGVVTVETELDLGAEKKVGKEIYGLIQGSDEADFTRGSAVLGAAETRYKCAARTSP